MFTGFVIFFLSMFGLGFGYRGELSFFNIAIQLMCLYGGIKTYYRLHPKDIDNYMLGVSLGLEATAIGVVGFTIFFMIFLHFNPTFMDAIRQNSNLGTYLNPFTGSLFILTEGLVVGLIGSYILTRYFGYTVKEV